MRLTAVLAVALALLTVYLVDPASAGVVLCPYLAITGTACPGCGLTRAIHHLLHADVRTAFAYNPLLFVAVPVAAACAVAARIAGDERGLRWQTRLGWAMLALTLAFWIWRNTPWYPLLRL